jgi:thiamine-phosphate pyrophosphorylase
LKDGFGFYAIITDPVVGYVALGKLLARRKVAVIQLRMKGVARREVLDVARQLKEILDGKESLFIINDDVSVAREVGADGVHLGQDDEDYHRARSFLGKDAVIGLSTHHMKQVQRANALGPDYIGVGPVFSTQTKKNPDPVLGPEAMGELVHAAQVPAVAIGGIQAQNVGQVRDHGAKNFCAVGALNSSHEPERALDELLAAWKRRKPAR